MKLFIDTWGWIELGNTRSQRHREVKNFYQKFQRKRGKIYTSDYVLSETISLLFQRLPYKLADQSLTQIQQSIAGGFLLLEWVTEERFERAIEFRRKYTDKPRISFTDFTSMVIMQELGIIDVLTEDDHFIQVGMGFNKVP